ncbi:hypothetical protein [Albidovulum sediminis]|uniref:Uncharacterized protein n=1 Tax=Albidovulum sediminis TaxID=3066345 RepID=A0ABT2NKR0_9RHOB|nr:hypothetical protein [Defluviimonas sediminis]MCT8329341.1 hypothetical protein [Defluviimonas sediminis]
MANAVADHIAAATTGHRLLATPDLRADPGHLDAARDLVRAIRTREPDLLRRILVRGTIAPREIQLTLDPHALSDALHLPAADLSPDLINLSAPVLLRRRGIEAKLVSGKAAPDPDPVLHRTLFEAHRWIADLRKGTPLATIAGRAGHHDAFIRTRAPLAFLSPKLQRAIRDGTLPPALTLHRILRRPIPLDWQDQERLYRL